MEVRDNYYTIVQGTVKLKVFTASLDEALHDEDLPRVRRLLLANWPPFHSPLMVASEQGWLSVVNRLLKAAANREDIDKKTHNTGMTALHFAICHSHFDIAFLLLENGASLFPKNKRGNSPLDSIQRLSQWWEVEDLVLQTWEKVERWKRRKPFVIFLSTLKTQKGQEAQAMHLVHTCVERVFLCRDLKELIGKFL